MDDKRKSRSKSKTIGGPRVLVPKSLKLKPKTMPRRKKTKAAVASTPSTAETATASAKIQDGLDAIPASSITRHKKRTEHGVVVRDDRASQTTIMFSTHKHAATQTTVINHEHAATQTTVDHKHAATQTPPWWSSED